MHTCWGHRPLPLSFSPLSGKWVVSRTALNEKPVYVEAEPLSSIDYSAAPLTAAERDSLVPQLYYRQLSAHEKLPDSINGKEMSMHSLRTHEAFFNSSPRDLLKRTSGIRLMMESFLSASTLKIRRKPSALPPTALSSSTLPPTKSTPTGRLASQRL